MSICPACYSPVPAAITIEGGSAIMQKTCPRHGTFVSMVERDASWYNYCKTLGHTNIYDGYFIDVTDRCNVKCKQCFYPLGNKDRDVNSIIGEATKYKSLAPFILTGGEPTMHPELPQVIKRLSAIGETWTLTNGIKLEDETYTQSLLDAGLLSKEGIITIGLSRHKEANGADVKFLCWCREKGYKVGSVQIVVDSLREVQYAAMFYVLYHDVIGVLRIKCATNLWHEQQVGETIYVSDVIRYLKTLGKVEMAKTGYNKVSYASILFNSMPMGIASWYSVDNVDLNDISCPPYYMAKDGTVNNFVTSCIRNEGIVDDSGIRARRAVKRDILELSYLWKDFILEENSNRNPNQEEWIRVTSGLVDDPNYYLLIVENESDGIIGFVDGYVTLEPALNEMCIMGKNTYVKPKYRKAGVAFRKLNRLITNMGKRRGVTSVLRPIVGQAETDKWVKKGGEILSTVIKTGYVGG